MSRKAFFLACAVMSDKALARTPKLRFSEFEGAWEERRLSSGITLISGQHLGPESYDTNGSKGVPYFTGPTDFCNTLEEVSKFSENASKTAERGDVLITVKGSGVGALWSLKLPKVAIGRQLMAIRGGEISAALVYHMLKTVRHRLEALASGNMIPGLTRDDILHQKLWVPPTLLEQEKVARFLDAIACREQLIERRLRALTSYKKSSIQKIFARALRFTKSDGSAFPDWQTKPLGDFLVEHGEFGSGSEQVHSVSVHKGIVDQIAHLGRSFSAADTSRYNRAKHGDLVYTKSPTGEFPYGIIRQSRLGKNVIVSPLYGVFTPVNYSLGVILDEYFRSSVNVYNYLHPLVQKGAKNTLNITNDRFLEGRLLLPTDPDEHVQIANFLLALGAKIDAVDRQLAAMRRFKDGLLQQLFV